MEKFSKLMENTFKLRENGTTVKTEIIAGVTTFMTMATARVLTATRNRK